MSEKTEVILTVKVGNKQKSFLLPPNRAEQAKNSFMRVGTPNDQILTSGQGVYISNALVKTVKASKPNGK